MTSAGPYHRPSNDSPLILTHPANLTASQLQNLALLTFERLNFPAVQILARPVAALYAMNAVSGVVVDVGLESTTITPVVDTVPHVPGVIEVQLGAVDCERYLVAVLRSQPALIAQLEGPRAEDLTVPPEVAALAQDTTSKLGRLATTLWRENYLRPVLLGGVALPKEQEEDGVTDIAAALVAGREQALMADKAAKSHKSAARREEDAKKKAAEEARKKAVAEGEEEADVASLEFEGRNVDVGFARQRFAEVLFAPELAPGGLKEGAVGVQEAVRISIGSLPNAQDRLAVWEGVSVIGELARVRSASCPSLISTLLLRTRTRLTLFGTRSWSFAALPQTLLSYLMPYILTDPESSSEAQPKNTRFLRIPKYFPEYINEGGYSAPFLGAEIVGKLGFGESTGKYYTTKVDYNHHVRFSLLFCCCPLHCSLLWR